MGCGLVWFHLVWFGVLVRLNGKILTPTPHFVHSALFFVVFATSNCRHITNTRSKNIFHYRREKVKSSCFSVPDTVKTQYFTSVISVKGVVSFSKWVCGHAREFNVCVRPSPIQRIQVSTSEPRGRALTMDECPSQWGWSLPRLRQATCSELCPCSPQVTPRFWSAFTVGQMGLCQPARPMRTKYLHFWGRCDRWGVQSGQRSKSYGFRTMLYLPVSQKSASQSKG